MLFDDNAGPVYFEYIGAGDGGPTNNKSVIDMIPLPTSSPFLFIVSFLTDQQSPGLQSTGEFLPRGKFDDRNNNNINLPWSKQQIGYLNRSSDVKVMLLASKCLDEQTMKSVCLQPLACCDLPHSCVFYL